MMTNWTERLSLRVAVILAGLLGSLSHIRTLFHGFVWDDDHFVVRNPAIRTWDAVGSWFTSAIAYAAPGIDAPMFRPVRNLSYLLDYSLAGLNPMMYHGTNILLHGINTALLCGLIVLLLRLYGDEKSSQIPATAEPTIGSGMGLPFVALLASLFWAWHPVQTEVVAWIKSRDEILFSLFLLLASHALIRSPKQPLWCWIGFALSTSFALLSKEMAVSYPAVLALILILWWKSSGRPILLKATLLSALLTVAFIVWRHQVLGRTEQVGRLSGSLWYDALTTLGVLWEYARIILVPWPQNADHQGFPILKSLLHPRALAGIAVLLAQSVVTVKLLRSGRTQSRYLAASLLFVPVALLPVLNIIPAMQYLAERFLYLPLIGIAVALALLLHRARSRTGPMLFSTLLIVLLVLSVLRQGDWASPSRLFAANYQQGWRTGLSTQRYASALFAEGRVQEAGVLMRTLLPRGPRGLYDADPAMAHQGYATVLSRIGSNDAALTHTMEALRLRPALPEALITLGVLRGKGGDHHGALEAFTSATIQAPGDPAILRYQEIARGFIRKGNQNPKPSGSDPSTTSSPSAQRP